MFLDSARGFSPVAVLVMTITFLGDITYGEGAVNLMSASGQPEVTLDDGKIVLGLLETWAQREVAIFRGIPYALPPVGPLRFKKPVGLMSPDVPRVNATQYRAACFTHEPTPAQSEDCLYLNVWVPTGGSTRLPLPVIVWVHGGAFILYAAYEQPGHWLAAKNDVIVVTFDYRLGPLGFLSTGDSASVGNYGLWDQHTALLWVQKNIAVFGGDPGAVTLVGESAGGMSITYHMLSPHSNSLFHRVIIQSGTLYSPIALQWKPEETARRVGQAVGCNCPAHDDMVDCLRQKSAHLIASTTIKLWLHDEARSFISFGWGPVEDGDIVPHLYAKNGTLLALPLSSSTAFNGAIMFGLNNNEGSLFQMYYAAELAKLDGFQNTMVKLVKPDFFKAVMTRVLQQMFKPLPDDAATFTTAAEVVTYKYRDWASGSPALTIPDVLAALGDSTFVSPVFQFIRQWLNSGLPGRNQMYLYVFDHYPGLLKEEGMQGMVHGADLFYTFGTVAEALRNFNAPEAFTAQEAKLSEDFMKLLANFAKSGNPATPDMPSDWPAWPLYDLRTQSYLAVSPTPRIATRYSADNITLWTSLVPKIVLSQSVTCSGEPKEDLTPAAGSCLAHDMSSILDLDGTC